MHVEHIHSEEEKGIEHWKCGGVEWERRRKIKVDDEEFIARDR